jgi:shikimate dehydrogenase
MPLGFGTSADDVPLTFATLPGGARVADHDAQALAATGGVLYDVVYGEWPTALASAWQRRGGRAIPGIGMLVRQALLQVRVFVHGHADAPLAGEQAVLAAMQAAVTGD